MSFSVIVPACNEEGCLRRTLEGIDAARALLLEEDGKVIVVDNASTDQTASIAAAAGAKVVSEPIRNVGRARNKGAACAAGEWFVFIDADTLVPELLFRRMRDALRDPGCIGGAVDVLTSANRLVVRLYLTIWRLIGAIAGMAQGAAQFCRREAFEAADGYDESLWMGEDVDFFWRLKKLARQSHARVEVLRDIRVRPSARRFDRWSVWEILVRTNPLFILLFRRRRAAWRGWYDELVR